MNQHLLMAELLHSLQRQMMAQQWWQSSPPAPLALQSDAPFCADTLTFSEWLQWVFVPKIRALIAKRAPLPTQSGLLPIAEEAWRGCAANDLLNIVTALDEVINNGALNEILFLRLRRDGHLN